MNQPINPETIPVGVVGLGLMGCSITTCLLIAGHPVVAVAPLPADMETAEPRIREHLAKAYQEGLFTKSPESYLEQLTITEDYGLLNDSKVVMECTLENIAIKKSVYEKIEAVVADDAIITSNTSAIPISLLQREVRLPARFVGLHWSEPSHTTRFLEVICGDLTDVSTAEWLYALSHLWGKEPTLVRKDIRGFITNRLMYAMYREAFNLVENGYATVEDVDRACRNNAGYWMTLVGVFRWMDLTGVPAYHTVMKDLFPTLSNQTEVPKLIDDIVQAGGKGVLNAQGFYDYTPEEAKLWKETYEEFSYDIRRLALKYPADVVKKKLAKDDG
ncbi:3-hydroxyacyl-CoA dehydrogenase family protein [Spirosoma sp. KCTC 42546]|uniref:3-hydroxyacyl-CoA dehydrogenase family protein n=1 Tax=Spirosoma sp. KCTC 42546 TaxID=2520506 RepID=UPI001159F280|nr:3-hydroxyacyl-CoA dehydrogenase family protein [Spirosoma sp. KCTC 42546]QDK78282.1 3-hydroxyacyl-CoA dehydrogenase family protein [Spirosoma sp. KCTC 42546]